MSRRDRERFWNKVKVCKGTGCWIWTASVRTWKKEPHDGGYGAFCLRGRIERAHRVAFKILFGHWPRKRLLHNCDNRRCVNVLEHIRPGTQKDNVKDMLARGRARHQNGGHHAQRNGQGGAAQDLEGRPHPSLEEKYV